jgi:hypothetical protein
MGSYAWISPLWRQSQVLDSVVAFTTGLGMVPVVPQFPFHPKSPTTSAHIPGDNAEVTLLNALWSPPMGAGKMSSKNYY